MTLTGATLRPTLPVMEYAHHTAICLVADALTAAFGAGWVVRSQGPIAFDDESEPERDVALVPGRVRDYAREHPARPALVVEVAESGLLLDRRYKGSLYARSRLAEYWIVNLVERVLEVYREPAADAENPAPWPDATGPRADRPRRVRSTRWQPRPP